MTPAEMREKLEGEYPELMTADGYDDAIIGIAEGWFETEGGSSHHCVVAYDYEKCVEILVAQGSTYEEADEWLQYNTLGAYVGEYTPVFIYDWRKE